MKEGSKLEYMEKIPDDELQKVPHTRAWESSEKTLKSRIKAVQQKVNWPFRNCLELKQDMLLFSFVQLRILDLEMEVDLLFWEKTWTRFEIFWYNICSDISF